MVPLRLYVKNEGLYVLNFGSLADCERWERDEDNDGRKTGSNHTKYSLLYKRALSRVPTLCHCHGLTQLPNLRGQVASCQRDVVLGAECVRENIAVLVDYSQRAELVLSLLMPLTPGGGVSEATIVQDSKDIRRHSKWGGREKKETEYKVYTKTLR